MNVLENVLAKWKNLHKLLQLCLSPIKNCHVPFNTDSRTYDALSLEILSLSSLFCNCHSVLNLLSNSTVTRNRTTLVTLSIRTHETSTLPSIFLLICSGIGT